MAIRHYWLMSAAAVGFRLVLVLFGGDLYLATRPEISIPLTSLLNLTTSHQTYGFILTVKDLSPNIGVLWYFFAEVFDFFRSFFIIVFNTNIIFMVLPLAIRFNHRPCFLAFVYTAIVTMLKSYPSVGDSALYLGLLGLFADELAGNQYLIYLFFLVTVHAIPLLGISTVLVVECVSSVIKRDRNLRLLATA